jgi:hypothetical protein
MSQHDPILIEEYRNPLIEQSKSFIFLYSNANHSPQQQQQQQLDHTSVDSIFINLLLYWTTILNDSKNLPHIYMPYSHALNTIKSIYLSSVEWKRNLSQNIMAFLSLPWLAAETSGADLDFFKDKGYKLCSANLIQQTPRATLLSLKRQCVQLICLLPKTICPQWRTQLISKCVRDEADEPLRICALKYIPYLIYFLGVSSNSLIFQLIHPALGHEKSLAVIDAYADLLNQICCLISRKLIVIRRATFSMDDLSLSSSRVELSDFFEMVCACCDKKKIDLQIVPKLITRKNIELFQTLYKRPKNVDTKAIMEFVYVLSGTKGLNQAEAHTASIRSRLLASLERAFNHLEFGRHLDQQTLVSHELALEKSSAKSKTATKCDLSYIYKETLSLLGDESLYSSTRFDFARFSIPKLICLSSLTPMPHQISASSLSSVFVPSRHDEATSYALGCSIFSLVSQSDPQLDHNFNLENQLCEGFLRAKSSKNLLDLFMYMMALGRFALSLKKCDEYLFVCVKHLLEIFDSDESSEWSLLACSLAQRQLFVLSKRINMQELVAEFEEKVCEIIVDTIYNSIRRHQIYYAQLKQQQQQQQQCTNSNSNSNPSSSYLQNANFSLKDVLRVFNLVDPSSFTRNYQRYLVPYLIFKTTQSEPNAELNYKVITRSLEFLARKVNGDVATLIEDNFPYIFTYVQFRNDETVVVATVFTYIKQEIGLDIDKLVNGNKQRLLNDLLSRLSPRHRATVLKAVYLLTSGSPVDMAKVSEKEMIESIEPGLLAALIHFDMCLLKSSINLKEKCQVLESLNMLIGLLGPQVITKVRYKIMTTLKLAMQQCSKQSELNCKLWDTFLRNVDKSALGAILNQVSVNLLQLLELQPYKISKIFEYLIIQNKEHLHAYFNELYFIPEHSSLQQVNQTLRKYIDVKCILESSLGSSDTSAASLKSLVNLIKHYLKGASHENADLRVKALEKLYSLLKQKCSQIQYLIERAENSQIISEIVSSLLNGCRDSDPRAKLLFGTCLGEIGAIDPANVQATASSSSFSATASKKMSASSSSSQTTPISNESYMNPSLVSEDSNEFSENFSYSLIIELSKAYLAARHTHEQDSASYAIQECLKIYGCSNSTKSLNTKLWSSFPDYFKEILTPLRTSKYEIQSFDNLGSLKTPIILSECKNYEEWVYKWCAYLISKIGTHFGGAVLDQQAGLGNYKNV